MTLCQCKNFKYNCKKVPFIYNLIFTKKHKYVKKICSFTFGVLLGIGFYVLILTDLDFTENSAFFITLTLCLYLGLINTCSRQIRCICCLTLPTFCGKVGRGVLKAFVIAFVISGPIANISNNSKEVVRVFACTTSLTFNLTKTRFELMFKPFVEAFFGVKSDVNEVKDTLRSIRDVSAPVVGEVEDETELRKLKEENDYMDEKMGDSSRNLEIEEKYKTVGEQVEAEKYEKMYLKKIELRCEDQFSKASNRCRDMFKSAYDSCYNAVTVFAAWLLCWPMKLDFICNIAEALGGSSRCDPAKDIDPGLGEGYSYLKHSRTEFANQFKGARLQYQLPKSSPPIDFRDSRDTAKAILHNVQQKKELIDDFFLILKRLLAFLLLRIILRAQFYHDKYLREIEFDNIYITPYFRKIDVRRQKQNKYILLPLKKIERKKLTDPCSIIPLKHEREHMFSESFLLILEMITATTFVLLDWLFFQMLDMVRRHAKIDYVQTGKHDLFLEIKGTGLIANLLRSIIKGFNVKKRINIQRSNEKCLPVPSLLPRYYLYKIYGTYLAIWVSIYLQMFTQRYLRVICGYFYPKQEKARVLHLYNQTLKRRRGYFKFMKKKIKKLIKQHRLRQNLNVCVILKIRYPQACKCLHIFPSARRECLICCETEPIYNSKFIECPNEDCYYIYCPECWLDAGNKCLACEFLDMEDDSSDEDSTEPESDG